jgi:hypothetical protein
MKEFLIFFVAPRLIVVIAGLINDHITFWFTLPEMWWMNYKIKSGRKYLRLL